MTARALLLALSLAGCGGPSAEGIRGPWEGAPGEVADPALAVDPATGEVLAAWVGGGGETWHLWFARSPNGGDSWSDPVRVTRSAGQVHPHAEASPRLVAAPGDRLALVWTNSIPVEGRRFPASDLLSAGSADGGRTWSEPVRVNDDAGGPPEGHTFHGAAWAGGDTLVVAWLDGRGMQHGTAAAPAPAGAAPDHAHADSASAVWAARSPDFGRTWEPNRPLWPSACPCCRVALADGPGGDVLAGWRAHLPGDVRDPVVAPLPAPGVPPAAPERVQADGWVYPACPHSGPALVAGPDGDSHVAWFTGKTGAAGVYYVRGDASGAYGPAVPLVTGEELPIAHPAAVALPGGGAAVIWDVAEDGGRRLTVARMGPDGREAARVEVPGSDAADHPRLTQLPAGALLVAWTVPGEESMARMARVELGR